MKIAVVVPVMVPVPPPRYGGIESMADILIRGLAGAGHEMTVFCAGGSTIKGPNIRRLEISPYPTANVPEENAFWESRQLEEVSLSRQAFDIIHFHYEPAVFRTESGCSDRMLDILRTPAVFTFHNTTDTEVYRKYYEQEVSLRKHAMVFVSDNQRRPLGSCFTDTHVVHNAIPVAMFPFRAIKDDYMLFLGRMAPCKGVREAIEVSRRIRVPLTIAARIDPCDRGYYEAEIEPFVDGRFVRYVGEVGFEEKTRLLAGAKCLLFPIRWEEPFGLVMIEALACGTPVIAFRKGAVPEVIREGIDGYVVDTVEEMADAVGKTENLSAHACREGVEARFESKEMIARYEKIFQDLLRR